MIIIKKSSKVKQENDRIASALLSQSKEAQTDSIVKLLDLRIAGWEEERTHKVVHMSDLTHEDGFCAREYALLDVTGKKPKGNYVGTALRVTYDNGHALAALCRNKWLEKDVIGTWICKACTKKRFTFTKKPDDKCNVCGAFDWEYEEEQFIDPFTKASGSIDFFIDFGTGKYIAVEVKTISKDDFKELKAPLAEHRVRTNLYLDLIKRSDRPEAKRVDTSYGIVLYISKGFGAKTEEAGKVTPFREFKVKYDSELAKPYWDKAKLINDFRRGIAPMPQGICPNGMCSRVKSCSVGKECWSGKWPAGINLEK